MSATGSVKRVTIEGLVTLTMNDGMEVQTTRRIDIELDMNGPGSSQFVSHLKVPGLEWQEEPCGLVDSEHPVVRQFFDRVMEVIANPSAGCFDVPARAAVQAAD
jgi:hypothetical protein